VVRMRTSAVTALALGAAATIPAACGSAGTPAATPSGPTAAVTPVTVSAKLRGSAEVPKGAPRGTGTASVSLDAGKDKACWSLSVAGVDKLLSAHVHEGAPGENGPVVIPLGAKYMERGCVIAPKATIRAVANNPAAYYVNVHTRTFLDGAVRGQLRKGAGS
jgi:CHRD domain-containing protein